ncbi:hypothetical protein QF117_10685 [Vibrio sp. YMD68]|nr:hypothetical protein [Vibrio sp. YMD68]WGW01855.1 hypothetical protein QF117_10685 [Vibrio sp. YMD68]
MSLGEIYDWQQRAKARYEQLNSEHGA